MEKHCWKGDKKETMIRDLQGKGVEILYYSDTHRPDDESIPVYNRKAFFDALGIPYNFEDVPATTYIEVADAYQIYRREDLKSRMSRLSEMSAQLELHIQKLTDNPEEADTLEETYHTLFAETLRIFGN